jgi:hypothetical protein
VAVLEAVRRHGEVLLELKRHIMQHPSKCQGKDEDEDEDDGDGMVG